MDDITIRAATKQDLDGLNSIIEAAIMTWQLPERVKRLTLPSYRYDEMDLQHLRIVVAETGGELLGVAAWEPAREIDTPADRRGLLLHGVYVHPGHHRQGIGSRLFQAAEAEVRKRGLDGLLVKAQKGSEPFYMALGMRKLPVADEQREFENRYWKETSAR